MFSCALSQAREQLAQEYEQVKDISSTLASFKTDSPGFSPAACDNRRLGRFEEPTRDPDVWPPPTPIEQRCVLIL